MSYHVNPTAFSAAFTVPCDVVDNRIKLATETQLKVLLFALRNLAAGIDEKMLSEGLGFAEKDVRDALDFWAQAGVFFSDGISVTPKPDVQAPVSKQEKPSRRDVALRGADDPRVRFLFAEAQQRFGRNLKSNEATTLLWLYDDQGMDISVILLLLQHADNENQLNISYVERTALKWIKAGVTNVTEAEQQITDAVRRKTAWGIVERVFGIEHRRPSEKEAGFADLWVHEWQFSAEMLKAAYDACVDAKAKLSMPYVAKILEKWHTVGYETRADIEAEQKKPAADQPNQYATYDIDAFEKMLNNKD